jgi:hypothetical protein
MSRPHSPLLAGDVPSKASARTANLAAAFFEAALGFFTLQHADSVFVFNCAAKRGALIPNAHMAPARTVAALRCRIFFVLIFLSCASFHAKV